jgi:hypothetical protein
MATSIHYFLKKNYTLLAALLISCPAVTITLLISAASAAQGTGVDLSCRLPPMSNIIAESLKILPMPLTDYDNLKKRMQLSVLLPELQLQYGRNESNYNLEDRRKSGLRWESEGRIILRWNLSEFLFHSQETDAIAVFQRTRENEVNLRSQVAADYESIMSALDQNQEEDVRSSIEQNAEARKSSARIDALTSNRFRLVDLVYSCLGR